MPNEIDLILNENIRVIIFKRASILWVCIDLFVDVFMLMQCCYYYVDRVTESFLSMRLIFNDVWRKVKRIIGVLEREF